MCKKSVSHNLVPAPRGAGTRVAVERRAGLFSDGVTFKILSDYYLRETAWQARLSFGGLDRLAEEVLSRLLKRACKVTDRHLFIGVRQYGQGGAGGLDPSFEAAMKRAGVTAHLLPRNCKGEKGVDTSLCLEMFGAAVEGRIDVAVLLATDGDFAPLARKMRSAGFPVALLAFHLPHKRPQPVLVSPALTDAATVVFLVSDWIERPPEGLAGLIPQIFWHGSGPVGLCA